MPRTHWAYNNQQACGWRVVCERARPPGGHRTHSCEHSLALREATCAAAGGMTVYQGTDRFPSVPQQRHAIARGFPEVRSRGRRPTRAGSREVAASRRRRGRGGRRCTHKRMKDRHRSVDERPMSIARGRRRAAPGRTSGRAERAGGARRRLRRRHHRRGLPRAATRGAAARQRSAGRKTRPCPCFEPPRGTRRCRATPWGRLGSSRCPVPCKRELATRTGRAILRHGPVEGPCARRHRVCAAGCAVRILLPAPVELWS